MRKATVLMDRDFAIGHTDPRLFGAFVEHLGRCVYGGIYEPGHPTADEKGFRRDVLDLVRELGPTIMRYPGGNFVSGYNWEDGVGPVEERPVKLDLAWFTTEPNTFGTNEFMDWCRPPMSSRCSRSTSAPAPATPRATSSNIATIRAAPIGPTCASSTAGRSRTTSSSGAWATRWMAPGRWNTRPPTQYGLVAKEAAKMMRWIDPSIELAACGSSGRNMPTFGRWEDEVLEHTFEHADYISLHTYLNNYAQDTEAFLACPDLMDQFIEEVVAVADGVAARRRSNKRIMLSFDEWNVWYRTRRKREDRVKEGWPIAPPILEEIYSMEDALAFGGACISLLNHADRVKSACLAQLVNVIAPIMTETGGPAWRQTIFHPVRADEPARPRQGAADAGGGETYEASYYDPRGSQDLYFPIPAVPYLKVSAVADEATGGLSPVPAQPRPQAGYRGVARCPGLRQARGEGSARDAP